MEFPEAGSHCSKTGCNLLDFLPISCNYCKLIFCKDHVLPDLHECAVAVQKPQDLSAPKNPIQFYHCNQDGCKLRDPIKMICVICQLHYCVLHRYHGCLDRNPSQDKRNRYRLPKEQFRIAKAETDKMVEERLRTAKNRNLANKIKRMKIKSTAIGDNHVPTTDRIYFSIAPPLLGSQCSHYRNLFVSKNWTLGKSVDFLAKKFRVKDGFEKADEPKLRLFDIEGKPIPGLLSDQISLLLELGVIIDGDSLILEYVPSIEMNNDLYDALTHPEILGKYKFS